MRNLAIVIPAYKSTYLENTLRSLAQQTCKDFTVYIGDDCSPYSIKKIVDEYMDVLDIRYTKFNSNIGGVDLVAQWERCIKLCQEQWIWLFSDDDYMSSDCIAFAINEFSKLPKYDIYRFNVDVVDRDNHTIKKVIYPEVINVKDLFKAKLRGRLDCYVVEFIFSRKIYEECGGFTSFDLAWGSDLATWIKFGNKLGIKTIAGPTVHWRSSGENISTIQDKPIVDRKIKALISFLNWGYNYFKSYDIVIINDIGLTKRLVSFGDIISNKEIVSYIRLYTSNVLRICFINFMFKIGRYLKKR